jgi:NAD(P) transhydrogenase subunit alpha
VPLEAKEPPKPSRVASTIVSLLSVVAAIAWVYLKFTAGSQSLNPSTQLFLQHLTVFILACFVGWQVVWSVTAALHTPLMSVTNAISGIIVVGGILQGRLDGSQAALYVGALAILFATINIFGGFLVTQRMLQMFRKEGA